MILLARDSGTRNREIRPRVSSNTVFLSVYTDFEHPAPSPTKCRHVWLEQFFEKARELE